MFGRAERLELLHTRAGKVVKRRHPGAKVEIQFTGVVVELK
jgi:hypothetical protein